MNPAQRRNDGSRKDLIDDEVSMQNPDAEQEEEFGCPMCGSALYVRPRLAERLSLPLLAIFLFLAVVGGVLMHDRGWYAAVPALFMLGLFIFFFYTPVGKRWYWGGHGCRSCGTFTMSR